MGSLFANIFRAPIFFLMLGRTALSPEIRCSDHLRFLETLHPNNLVYVSGTKFFSFPYLSVTLSHGGSPPVFILFCAVMISVNVVFSLFIIKPLLLRKLLTLFRLVSVFFWFYALVVLDTTTVASSA